MHSIPLSEQYVYPTQCSRVVEIANWGLISQVPDPLKDLPKKNKRQMQSVGEWHGSFARESES
jgi:hypothetical protein